MTRWWSLLFAALLACPRKSPPPPALVEASAPIVAVPEAAAPPATWPAAVDLTLAAPNGFHLIALRGDDALVRVTAMVPIQIPPGNFGHGSTEYLARFDLRTGCMNATYDFRAAAAASSLGTVKESMEVLAAAATSREVALAKKVSAAFGPNDTPIRVTPDARNVVLEANNELYWSKDGAPFTHIPGIASGPLVSDDGRWLLYGSGGGTYRPALLDFATGRTRAVGRKTGSALQLIEAYPMTDGTFVSVEGDGDGLHDSTKVCVGQIDPKTGVETQAFCLPSEMISASVSWMSADRRYLALRVEHRSGDRIMTFETTTWKKVTDASGMPNYMDADDRGRVAWDDFGRRSIVVADGAVVTPITVPEGPYPDIEPTFVGFSGHRFIVGYPAVSMIATQDLTLRDLQPCGHLRVID